MPPGTKRTKKTPVEPTALEQSSLNVISGPATDIIVSTPVPVEPATKKKQKKPVKVVAVVTPNGIEGSFTSEPRRSLIAHLRVSSSDAPLSGDVQLGEPEPYNPDDIYGGNKEIIMDTVEEEAGEAGAAVEETKPMQCFEKINLMVQYMESSKAKKLPARTEIACFWCAHTFDGQPCIIPEREVHGVYNVYGNFCCPECSLSYLLSETIDPHVRWERIALLHRIYDREGRGRMSPAPGREVLKLFGGPLSIESYRMTVRQGKLRVDTHMPPMVSILGSIDTKPIDFFDTSLKNTLIGSLQMEKTTKAEEGLRLKRSKPLKDRESTLDSVMSIQIKSAHRR
jgi:hypothetical protein